MSDIDQEQRTLTGGYSDPDGLSPLQKAEKEQWAVFNREMALVAAIALMIVAVFVVAIWLL